MSATGRGAVRREHDAYQTPRWVIEALLDKIGPLVHGKTVLEPCAGEGEIVRSLQERGALVTAFDIQAGTDFLAVDCADKHWDWCITNPPYRYAQEFADKAMQVADAVVMLLRLGFLAGQKRRAWWQAHKPDVVYVLSRRPSFTGRGTDSTDYAWVLWRPRRHDTSCTLLQWL
ncbi:MAG: hypothetical protein K6T78_08080 [Alicyclobacillus sp.]|nr:hypothetical protein [Alicyclobacillus sp.]